MLSSQRVNSVDGPCAAEAVAARWGGENPAATTVIAALEPGDLVRVGADERRPLSELAGRTVLAVSAIGVPASFEGQLADLGATVISSAFADHHAFSDSEIFGMVARGADSRMVVCTLKDAVKLAGRWPRQAPPLWYLSQAVTIERGAGELDLLLARSVAASR